MTPCGWRSARWRRTRCGCSPTGGVRRRGHGSVLGTLTVNVVGSAVLGVLLGLRRRLPRRPGAGGHRLLRHADDLLHLRLRRRPAGGGAAGRSCAGLPGGQPGARNRYRGGRILASPDRVGDGMADNAEAKHGADSPVVVVANRLPVDQVTDPDGSTRWQRSPGGLVTALEPFVAGRGGAWVGWSGSAGEAPEPFESGGMSLIPVPLSEDEVDRYYEGMSNASLWPLYHDVVEKPEYHRTWWDTYVQVNKRFAERAAAVAAEGAIVWVHDYQLQLVPAMLRQRRPDLTIGFFLHIPFPPYELFTQLPWRSAIVEGLLGADLVGFQRPAAARRTSSSSPAGCTTCRPRGSRSSTRSARSSRRRSRSPSTSRRSTSWPARRRYSPALTEIRKELGNPTQDHPRGRPARLHQGHRRPAERLRGTAGGRRRRGSRHRAGAGGDAEPRARRALRAHARDHRAAGRPHQRHLRLDRRPRGALLQPVDAARGARRAVPGGRRHARDALPRRHEPRGEGVRRRPGRSRGALVLSEFAGAAAELKQSFLVNPHDIAGVKNQLVRALRVEPAEAARRMRSMRRHLFKNDLEHWAGSFFDALRAQAGDRPPGGARRGPRRPGPSAGRC